MKRKTSILLALTCILFLCTGFSIYWVSPLKVNGKEKIKIVSGDTVHICFNCESHHINHSAASIVGRFHFKGDFTVHGDSCRMVYRSWDGKEEIRIDTLCAFSMGKGYFCRYQQFTDTREVKNEWIIECVLEPNRILPDSPLHPLATGCIDILPCNFITHQGKPTITDTIRIAYTNNHPLHTTTDKRPLTKYEQKRFYSLLLNDRHYGTAIGRKKAIPFLEEDSLHYFTINPIYLRKNFRICKDSIVSYIIFEYQNGHKRPRHYSIYHQADKDWLTQFMKGMR